MSDRIHCHRDLIDYQKSFSAGKRILEFSRSLPRDEMHSLTGQVRRSSRIVSANIAEAWRKRRYERLLCSTLNIAESEAAETQVGIEYAAAHGYLVAQKAKPANDFYDEILWTIVAMIASPEKRWICKRDKKKGRHRDTERVEKKVKDDGAACVIDEAASIDQWKRLTVSSDLPGSLSPPLRASVSRKSESDDA